MENLSPKIILGCIEALVLFFAYLYSTKAHKPHAKDIGYLCFFAAFLRIEKMMTALTYKSVLFPAVYSVYEINHLWFYYATLILVLSYNHQRDSVKLKIWFFRIVVLIDTVLLFVNCIFGYVQGKDAEGNLIGIMEFNHIFMIHLMFMSIFLLYIVLQMLKKISSLYYIFWPRYFILGGIISFTLGNDIYRVFRMDENYIVYGGEWIFLSVCALFVLLLCIRSKVARSYEYSFLFEEISQYTFFFDSEDTCVLVNNDAIKFFGLDRFDLSNVKNIIHKITNGEEEKEESDIFEKTYKYKSGDKKYYLKLNYNKLRDRDMIIGSIYGITDITEDMERLEEETYNARYDSFTHVYNYDHLLKEIEDTIMGDPRGYYIIGSDIRDFKVFNDVFGTEVGDAVIIHMSQLLRQLCKDGIIKKYGRIHGDKFGMLAQKSDFKKNVLIDSFMGIDYPFKEDYYHLNIHFGIYETDMEPDVSVATMFDRAYVALDTIKNDVNIRTYFYNLEMRDEKIWEQTVSSNIERALREGQIRIVVQPQVDRKETVIGGESLIRWHHPDNGEISPANFIPILEKTGLVTKADVFVWEESCKLLKKWQTLGYDNYYISVNISTTDFIFADLYTIFTELIDKYQINPQSLKLEITESAMMTDILERILLINRLKEYGFTIELDDFGSGYSSLNMLKDIPVDVIKLDMKFLYGYKDEPKSVNRKIIGHMCSMAKDLDMMIVAEGVEDVAQLDFLKSIGCDVFQGYYFSRPIEISEFESKQGIA